MQPRQLRVLGVCGSLRERSYNLALLKAAGAALADVAAFEIAEIGDLPLYNRDVEVEGLPEPVRRFRDQIAAADAVVFASPEYNWSVTGALKNAIDWASRNPLSPLDHRPAAIIGGGGRGGTARSQAHLREVLMHNRVDVLEESEVLVPSVWTAFDDGLALVDDRVRADVEIFAGALEDHVRRDMNHRPAVVFVGATPEAASRAFRLLVADYRVVLAEVVDGLDDLVRRWSPAAFVVGEETGEALVDLLAGLAPEAPVVPVDFAAPDGLPGAVAAALSRD